MIPEFLIIGAEKSGTTWLYKKLKQHPEIYLPLTKECHFFNKYNSNLKEIDRYKNMGWNWYKKFFDSKPDNAQAGEITPMYICDPQAPARIARDLPGIKLIYILRNPVTRAYSHYWMAFRKGHINKKFEEIVEEKNPQIILRGKYASQLERYYDLFPKENIKGYIYESFFQNSHKGLESIHEFLGVRKLPVKQELRKKVLASPKPKSKILGTIIAGTAQKMRKNPFTFELLDWIKKTGAASLIKNWNTEEVPYPPMDKAIYEKLFEFYEPEIETLKKYNLNIDIWEEFENYNL